MLVLGVFLVSLTFESSLYTNTELWINFTQKLSFLMTFLLLVIVFFLVYVMVTNSHLKQLTANYEQQINAQAKHYELLAKSTYELRRFKHDFKNMSIAIEHLLQKEGHSESLELFKKYNGTLSNNQFSTISFDTGNGIADALLTEKQQKAFAYNSTISFDGCIPQEGLAPTDICVILGNTLDNAIEACAKLPLEVAKIISISCQCNSGFLFLTIRNPIAQTVNIKNNFILTTKKNKTLHGFGLYSLNTIVKNYDGDMQLKTQDNTFTIDITLCLSSIRRA